MVSAYAVVALLAVATQAVLLVTLHVFPTKYDGHQAPVRRYSRAARSPAIAAAALAERGGATNTFHVLPRASAGHRSIPMQHENGCIVAEFATVVVEHRSDEVPDD